jgi:hypothetical protein
MPPPAPLDCSVEDCYFKTAAGAPTWEIMVTLLTTHTQAVHGGSRQQTLSSQFMLEKLPRPTFTLNMTESQWSFVKTQWDNYIQQTQVSPAVELMQLQAACDGPLQQKILDSGACSSLTNTNLFIAKIKELAVIVATNVLNSEGQVEQFFSQNRKPRKIRERHNNKRKFMQVKMEAKMFKQDPEYYEAGADEMQGYQENFSIDSNRDGTDRSTDNDGDNDEPKSIQANPKTDVATSKYYFSDKERERNKNNGSDNEGNETKSHQAKQTTKLDINEPTFSDRESDGATDRDSKKDNYEEKASKANHDNMVDISNQAPPRPVPTSANVLPKQFVSYGYTSSGLSIPSPLFTSSSSFPSYTMFNQARSFPPQYSSYTSNRVGSVFEKYRPPYVGDRNSANGNHEPKSNQGNQTTEVDISKSTFYDRNGDRNRNKYSNNDQQKSEPKQKTGIQPCSICQFPCFKRVALQAHMVTECRLINQTVGKTKDYSCSLSLNVSQMPSGDIVGIE